METQCHTHVKTRKPLKRPSESEAARDSEARIVNRRKRDINTLGEPSSDRKHEF